MKRKFLIRSVGLSMLLFFAYYIFSEKTPQQIYNPETTKCAKVLQSLVLNETAFDESLYLAECLKQSRKISPFWPTNSAHDEFIISFLPQYSPESYRTPIKVDWFSYIDYYNYNLTYYSHKRAWSKSFSQDDHQKLMNLLELLTELLSKHSIEYMLSGSSLVGSMRHFDQIPWNVNSTLAVDEKYKKILTEVLENQNDSLVWKKLNNHEYKVVMKTNTSFESEQPKISSVDIGFFSANETHILRNIHGRQEAIPKEIVYPLKLRPFGKFWLPAPKRPDIYLSYGNFYKDCILQNGEKVGCETLHGMYSFAHRTCEMVLNQSVCFESMNYYQKQMIVLVYYSEPISIKLVI